jgi:hypothetical protein
MSIENSILSCKEYFVEIQTLKWTFSTIKILTAVKIASVILLNLMLNNNNINANYN